MSFNLDLLRRLKRLENLVQMVGGIAPSSPATRWTDVAAGTTLSASLLRPNLSCDSSAAQTAITLPTAAQMVNEDGFSFAIKATGSMLSPVIVNAGAGTTLELIQSDPGTFGGATWLAIQGQTVVFKYDKATTSWKAFSSFAGNGAAGTIAFNPGWYAFAEVDIDPQNASGLAKDSNSGAPGAPLLHYAEAQRRWGSTSPVLPVSCVVKFLSSHTDNTDPVIFNPLPALAGTPSLQGAAPTVVTAGVVLGGVTAKNRTLGANSPLIATLGATAVVGQMVINTTAGKSSRAWVMRALGGNSFELSQPMVPVSLATPNAFPAEVNTWANGDTVNLVAPIQVNLVEVSSTMIDPNAGFNNVLQVYQLTVFDPDGVGSSGFYVGGNVFFLEASIQKFWTASQTSPLYFRDLYTNCLLVGSGFAFGSDLAFTGGGFIGSELDFNSCFTGFDGDFVQEAPIGILGGSVTFGFFYSGDAQILLGQNGVSCTPTLATGNYGGHVIYGRAGAGMIISGNTRLVDASGTWVAAITHPSMVTGLTLNGGTVAQTHTNATPDVVTSNVATTPTNADAANGGNMQVWGGASLSKAA